MDPKYLYIFKSRDGFYKIGISNNVESRLASIRTSNHDDVEIVIARRLNDAFNFEQAFLAEHGLIGSGHGYDRRHCKASDKSSD